jgi:hypothetical protein
MSDEEIYTCWECGKDIPERDSFFFDGTNRFWHNECHPAYVFSALEQEMGEEWKRWCEEAGLDD